jgi:hypothetical protein
MAVISHIFKKGIIEVPILCNHGLTYPKHKTDDPARECSRDQAMEMERATHPLFDTPDPI